MAKTVLISYVSKKLNHIKVKEDIKGKKYHVRAL